MKDVDETLPFSELDLSKVDFKSPYWSWGGSPESMEIRWCDDADGKFHVKRYEVPQCILSIIADCERHAVGKLRGELIDIETRRNRLIFGDDQP